MTPDYAEEQLFNARAALAEAERRYCDARNGGVEELDQDLLLMASARRTYELAERRAFEVRLREERRRG